jgi:hypothetical protein
VKIARLKRYYSSWRIVTGCLTRLIHDWRVLSCVRQGLGFFMYRLESRGIAGVTIKEHRIHVLGLFINLSRRRSFLALSPLL